MSFENEFSAVAFNVSCFSNRLKARISTGEILVFGKILAYAELKEGQFFERFFGPKPAKSNSEGSQLTFRYKTGKLRLNGIGVCSRWISCFLASCVCPKFLVFSVKILAFCPKFSRSGKPCVSAKIFAFYSKLLLSSKSLRFS